jgi:molybdate transport system substrate-binding protein
MLLCLMLVAWLALPAQAADAPAVAAAADLTYALRDIAQRFHSDSGRQVRLSFGSSGNFAQQIVHGAPFELFLSADERYVQRLAKQGFTRDAGALYAIGRIVLFVPHGSPLKADAQLVDLGNALRDGRLKRFAIANPEHAPYGRAAREALQHAGLWERIQTRLVLGENASQATQFAASGSTQGGIVPLSLSRAPEIARLGMFALISAQWHRPLRQRMVLLKGADAVAEAFYRYLQTPEAREVFRHYGFVLPGED